MGTQGTREIASDVHLDGRTSSREIPGEGKGLIKISLKHPSSEGGDQRDWLRGLMVMEAVLVAQ